jgi:hypothetical protein
VEVCGKTRAKGKKGVKGIFMRILLRLPKSSIDLFTFLLYQELF